MEFSCTKTGILAHIALQKTNTHHHHHGFVFWLRVCWHSRGLFHERTGPTMMMTTIMGHNQRLLMHTNSNQTKANNHTKPQHTLHINSSFVTFALPKRKKNWDESASFVSSYSPSIPKCVRQTFGEKLSNNFQNKKSQNLKISLFYN